MSIRSELAKLVGDGKLIHLLPVESWRSVERDVFVSVEVNAFLQGNDPEPGFSNVGLRAFRQVERFIVGSRFVFGMDPRDKKSTCLISRNDDVSQGVVEVRVNDPQPAVRIFGCFAEKDVLVLLTWRSRKMLQMKGFAGSVKDCEKRWNTLFPRHIPHVKENPHEYISGLFDIG